MIIQTNGNDKVLMEQLPTWFKPVLEYIELMRVYGSVIDDFQSKMARIYANFFLQTADEETIALWEGILGITPLSSDTLEFRRQRVLAAFMRLIPYTIQSFKEQANALFGEDGWSYLADPENNTLTLTILTGQQGAIDLLYSLIWAMVPTHLDLDVSQDVHTVVDADFYLGAFVSDSQIKAVLQHYVNTATLSGAVVSFQNQLGLIPVAEAIAEITPDQPGTGDPSPTNIRPIYGRLAMTVAAAAASPTYTLDEGTTLFRRCPASGNLAWPVILGATVAFNQLVQNGDFSDGVTGWSKNTTASIAAANNVLTLTMNGPSASHRVFHSVDAPIGHKYFITAKVRTSGGIPIGVGLSATGDATPSIISTITVANTWAVLSGILNPSVSGYIVVRLVGQTPASSGTIDISNVMLIDLTQMFGAAIADYAYSLEQAQAGSGIAWIRSYGYLTAPYYAYNPGELKSGEPTAIETTGFNLWDEEWELGYYEPDTGLPHAGDFVRSKNAIAVLPETECCATTLSSAGYVRIICYKTEDTAAYIRKIVPNSSSFTFTTPTDCYFIRFYMSAPYGRAYNHDICINFSDPAKNGTYEPSQKRSYPLDPDAKPRGILKLSGDKLVCDGDEYRAPGKVWRRFRIVDLGMLNWEMSPSTGIFRVTIARKCGAGVYSMFCSRYVTYTGGHSTQANIESLVAANGNMLYVNSGSSTFFIADSAYTDAATFKAAMSGVYLLHELENPYLEDVDPFTVPMVVSPYGTERFVSEFPAGFSTKYLDQEAPFPATIDLGRTVYAGTVNLTTGVLTVTRGRIIFNGTENFGMQANSGAAQRFRTPLISDMRTETMHGHILSNQFIDDPAFVTTGTNIDQYTGCVGSYSGTIRFAAVYADVAAFKAFLAAQYAAGYPVECIYELATPRAYQLTPEEVFALVQQNYIFTDAGGDVTITYKED